MVYNYPINSMLHSISAVFLEAHFIQFMYNTYLYCPCYLDASMVNVPWTFKC